jgi:glycosyltransferase involved in cell wall biosynthesis
MSTIPRVSIGLPVYNGEEFLEQALDSILLQSYPDFELIICDNGSTDQTSAICSKYTARDSRIRYYRNIENVGVDRNFNRTFELSKGDYFRWAAADDVCSPELLGRCVDTLDGDHGVVLCYPKSRYIDEYGNVTRDYDDGLHLDMATPSARLERYMREVDMCNAIFGLIRSDVLRKTGLCGTYSDSDLVLLGELSLYGRFFEIPETLFFRRIHSGIAVRKYPTAQERMVMSEPALAGRLTFPHWKVILGFARGIHRARLPLVEMLLCYSRIFIWLRSRRRDLIFDLRFALRHLMTRIHLRDSH